MARKLSKKQKGFIKDYVKTGNGTQSALKNYDTKDETVASSIATENLTKPLIQEAIKSIADQIPDELLVEKHLQLLNATDIGHMVFPIALSDQEITELLATVNCVPKKIQHGETANHVWFWQRDNKAIKDGVDLAYKIKGTYAPEKIKISGDLRFGEMEKLSNDELAKLAEGSTS